jgi:hypothetical protein
MPRALDIITGAFDVANIYAPGQSIQAADVDGAFRRLNLMMSALALQPLTKPVNVREVFPLTADVGVYTMGPGGDFDTTRPINLTGCAILLNSQGTPVSVTSITRSGSVATVTTTAPHGATTGQNVTIAGAAQPAYNGTDDLTVTGASTFTYLVNGEPASPATGTITASIESNDASVVEVPRSLFTDDAWQQVRIKALQSAQFIGVYYNPTFTVGLGTINLWPIPNVATNSIVLYQLTPLSTFVSLTADYALPPGCEEALEYNLARRLLSPYGIIDQGIVSDVLDLAKSSLATFKRGNMKLSDLATDPALTRNPRGTYNILTGSGTGGG